MKIEEMRKYNLPRIKRCPFCGGFSTVTNSSKTYIKGELTKITYCYCTVCDARGRRVILYDDGMTLSQSYKKAIEYWNRRVDE